jgi:hypothetical protein
MSAGDLALAELTTALIRDVFKAATDSALEQTEAFMSLVAQVGVPVEAYQARFLGSTTAEQERTAQRYVRDVLLPLLSLPTLRPGMDLPSQVKCGDGGRQLLIDHFRGVIASFAAPDDPAAERSIEQVILPSGSPPAPWQVGVGDLVRFALARLARQAEGSYARLTGLLKAGLPTVALTGGQVAAKVTMQLSRPAPTFPPPADGSDSQPPGFPSIPPTAAPAAFSSAPPAVRLANERSLGLTRSGIDFLGTVTLDFRTSTFPAIDPIPGTSSQ